MEQMMSPRAKSQRDTEAETLAGVIGPGDEHFAHLITLPP